jgi:alternaria allergen 1
VLLDGVSRNQNLSSNFHFLPNTTPNLSLFRPSAQHHTMRSTLFLLLAPLALASPIVLEARNTTKSCMVRSPGMTEWQLEDFDFHASYVFSTPSHQNSLGYVSFTAVNPVHDTRTKCSAQSNRLNDFFYGDVEYACETDGDRNLGAAKFTFDRPSGEVKMEQTWYCHDNPAFPP